MKTSFSEAAPKDILRLVFKACLKDDLAMLFMVNKRFKAGALLELHI
jgi:hypothetical protein